MDDLPLASRPQRRLSAVIKRVCEDFWVDEIPAYEPSGRGEHLFVHFEKVGLDTREAVRRIAAALGVDPRDTGWAGLKDRHAVTTQWASFYRGDPARLARATIEGVRILRTERHFHKLRTGHLRGNRFRILLRGAPPEALEDVRAVLSTLAARGVPAYFGKQRFGVGRTNVERARAWLIQGGPPPRDRFERKLLVSVLQAELFNMLCAERVREGTYADVIDGDLCRKEETGGLFVATDLPTERERAARFEISATGPMFGDAMCWPEGEARRREEEVLARAGLDRAAMARFAKWGAGTRRPYRARLRAPEAALVPDGILVAFELPPGMYATVVIREILG
jgi:tRNA pseudouridine13 synthase